jgi:pantothenate kinase type III
MPSHSDTTLVAVDIGNSRIKLGRFQSLTAALPAPLQTLDLPLANRDGEFNEAQFEKWCESTVTGDALWWISSVHSGARDRFLEHVPGIAKQLKRNWSLHSIANEEVPLRIDVDLPERGSADGGASGEPAAASGASGHRH